MSRFGKCNFSFLNAQVQINSKLNEKNLINNVNTKKFTWRECWKIFLEAFFFHQENFPHKIFVIILLVLV